MSGKECPEYNWGVAVLELFLKPGYLYGKAEDGHIYCCPADIPKPGETVTFTARMPKQKEAKE